MRVKKISAVSTIHANQIVAGVAGQRIFVYAYHLSFSGTVNAKWQDGSTDLTGLDYGVAGVISDSPTTKGQMGSAPLFSCAAGDDLNLNLSVGSVPVSGYVVYDQR
jgi:hypothetical protein